MLFEIQTTRYSIVSNAVSRICVSAILDAIYACIVINALPNLTRAGSKLSRSGFAVLEIRNLLFFSRGSQTTAALVDKRKTATKRRLGMVEIPGVTATAEPRAQHAANPTSRQATNGHSTGHTTKHTLHVHTTQTPEVL